MMQKEIFRINLERLIVIKPWLKNNLNLNLLIDRIYPFILDISLFILYGSLINKEDSFADIDVIFAIHKKDKNIIKDKLKDLLKKKEFDIKILATENIKNDLIYEPLLLKQAVKNGTVLIRDDLKRLIEEYKIPKRKILEYLESTKNIIDKERKLLELGIDNGIIGAICYSVGLRARLLCILENPNQAKITRTKRRFNEFVNDYQLVEKVFEIYKIEKQDKRKRYKMTKFELTKIFISLNNFLKVVENNV